MSTIGGIGTLGGYSGLSSVGTKGQSAFREDALFSLPKANAAIASKLPREDNVESYQAAQAVDDGFAKLRLGMQNLGIGTAESSLLTESSSGSGSAALDEFKKYMDMTPAEKMRDSILKELGLTEEELDAMPPEQQTAVEEKIVQRIKERSEVAISGGNDGQKSNPWMAQQVGSGSSDYADTQMSFSQLA
ncbi:hypothetical protein ACIGCM_00760 [Pseudomonas sp. NPDC078700]|uniref:hypothetical protein n=1 Tax=Pseudomonas sp. NPDC078700 TaxID=3364424 RepID=UPI0037CA8B68